MFAIWWLKKQEQNSAYTSLKVLSWIVCDQNRVICLLSKQHLTGQSLLSEYLNQNQNILQTEFITGHRRITDFLISCFDT